MVGWFVAGRRGIRRTRDFYRHMLPAILDSRSTRRTANGARTDRGPERTAGQSAGPCSIRVYTEQRPIRLWLGASTIRTFRALRRCMNGSIAPHPPPATFFRPSTTTSTLLYSIPFYSPPLHFSFLSLLSLSVVQTPDRCVYARRSFPFVRCWSRLVCPLRRVGYDCCFA